MRVSSLLKPCLIRWQSISVGQGVSWPMYWQSSFRIRDFLKSGPTNALMLVQSSLSRLCHFRGARVFFLLHKELRCESVFRSEEHTSELQSRENLVCRLLLEKKKLKKYTTN